MIPIDRKEQTRQETEPILNKDSNDEQQSNNQENSSEEIIKDTASINEPTRNDEYVLYKLIKKTTTLMDFNSREVLFGGTDIDYRDTDVITQQKPTTATNVPNIDTDRLFKLNSECLSLAEQKFKSKELSSEEYQATLKLLQNILQTEVQRLTVPSTLVIFYLF